MRNRPFIRMSSKLFAILTATSALFSLARAQDSVAGLPKNYSLALENDMVAVVRVHYGPHEKIGVHDHSRFPTVYVYLSNSGPVRFEHLEEHPFSLTRPPTEKGAFRVSPGRLERHGVENLGNESSDFLRVELKQLPLGSVRQFRGKAPPTPLRSQTSVEFATPGLEIQRVVCEISSGCPLNLSSAPSLIVAFSSIQLAMGISGKESEQLEAGTVRWLASSERASIKGDALSSAHILRILLPAVP